MMETLEKLRPDRDLQCYFQRPSAVAALSSATPAGFSVSGSWRQQFDWAVIEWNRDNVFEHPSFRYLPDGDLSGLTLEYDEERTNCIPIDSDLYPTVDWPSLRIWADAGSGEDLYKVRLLDYAAPVAGSYQPASVTLGLSGTPTQGDYVGFAVLNEHYTYQFLAADTIANALQALVNAVNAFSAFLRASLSGTTILVEYVGNGQTVQTSKTGANGNRLGVYTYVSGAGTESWSDSWKQFSGGVSPSRWRITLPFGSLQDTLGRNVPSASIRKMRWTYSADLQPGAFLRSDFQVSVMNWAVTGSNRGYLVAGPGSRRIDSRSGDIHYSGSWSEAAGNFSGGSIGSTTQPGSSLTCSYHSAQDHQLYLGTRITFNSGTISVAVDNGTPVTWNLYVAGEDVLTRRLIGQLGPGDHTVSVVYSGNSGSYFYFDFLEIVIPNSTLPSSRGEGQLTLATDWDTDHSIALPAERTAWMISALGFHGRANHYAGALWFYELITKDHQYALGTITFVGAPEPNLITEVRIGRTGQPSSSDAVIQHLNVIGDTTQTLARAFALELNRGYTAVRADCQGNVLTIYSRSMGVDGNAITFSAKAAGTQLSVQASGATLTGGVDGTWITDLTAMPRINRAARDWTRAFCRALNTGGIDVVTAFSMELQHGDASVGAAIAQRYPSGSPVLLNTPAVQTNFSPQSTSFWKQVYLDMAQVQAEAGCRPFLQFGEVQWWYFPYDGSGMPFYDAYTTSTFRTQFGRDMQVIPSNTADPAPFSTELGFVSGLIGAFTNTIMSFVKASYPDCRFEVLYPPDVNATALNGIANYPTNDWTPGVLTCLKTESFSYTYSRDLESSKISIATSATHAFPLTQRSHLVGISDPTTAWLREVRLAEAEGLESVVLFALDQFCLIGYGTPLSSGARRSLQMA